MAILELSNIGFLAKLLIAARKMAIGDDPFVRLKAVAELGDSAAKLSSAVTSSGLEGVAREIEDVVQDVDQSFDRDRNIEDARRLFRLVLPTAIGGCPDLARRDLDPDKIVKDMLVAVRASGFSRDFFASSTAEVYFQTILKAALDRLLSNSSHIDQLSPRLWRELLRRGTEEAELSEKRHQELLQQIKTSKEASRLRQAGVTERAIIELARRVAKDVDEIDQAWTEVAAAMEVAVRVQEEGRVGSNLGEFVDEVLRRIASLSSLGKFDEASLQIDQALEIQEEENRARVTRLLDAGLEQDRLRRDPQSASKRAIQKRRIEDSAELDRFDLLNSVFFDYRDQGINSAVNFDLEVAIEIAREMKVGACSPDQLGTALINLCMALGDLGERQAGTTTLEEAVENYGRLLSFWKKSNVPDDWALAKSNLGNALLSLGVRDSSHGRLKAAIEAYKASLEVQSRDGNPLRWARIQNNLGNALQALGDRNNDRKLFEAAIDCYRKALSERTRERVPEEWAATKNSLGSVLWLLGVSQWDANTVKKAIAEYTEALKERQRASYPLYWAATQHNIGLAYLSLAEFGSDASVLEKAVSSFGSALEETNREATPFDWSSNNHHLGTALRVLGQFHESKELLEQSAAALNNALEVRKQSRFPLDWAATQNNLGITYAILATHDNEVAFLEKSIEAFESALTQLTINAAPVKRAETLYNLGNALLETFMITHDSSLLERAKNTIEAALSNFSNNDAGKFTNLANSRLEEIAQYQLL